MGRYEVASWRDLFSIVFVFQLGDAEKEEEQDGEKELAATRKSEIRPHRPVG
jgi:hypothetical protein